MTTCKISMSDSKYSMYHIHYRHKIWNIWKAQPKHSYLTWEFAGSGLAPANKMCYDLNATLSYIARDNKYKVQCPKLKLQNKIYSNVSFFITLPNISHSLQRIHRYIVNLWEFCGCWVIHHCHRSQDNNFSAKKWQHVWLKVSISEFGDILKICFTCMNSVYWNKEKPCPKL